MEGNLTTVAERNLKNDEARARRLKQQLEELLREAAKVEVQLSRADGSIRGIPHYSVIEGRAHELGKQLSRQIQQQQMNELSAVDDETAKCPTCDTRCKLTSGKRRVKTVDGETELQELEGYCHRCRRSFFPAS